MTTQIIDVIIVNDPSVTTKTISPSDKDKLEKNVDFRLEQAEIEGKPFVADEETAESKDIDDQIEEFFQLSRDVIKEAELVAEEIEARGAGLTYYFNPDNEDQLSTFIKDIYDGSSGDRVTFAMYKKAVEFRHKLDLELSKQQSGGANF